MTGHRIQLKNSRIDRLSSNLDSVVYAPRQCARSKKLIAHSRELGLRIVARGAD